MRRVICCFFCRRTYIQSKNIIYAFFLLEENVRPRKSRERPISAFLASSLGYVLVSMIALPIDSNWSKNRFKQILIVEFSKNEFHWANKYIRKYTYSLMVTWNYKNVLHLPLNRPSTIDQVTCKTYYGIAFHWSPHCCPKMKNAHSERTLNISGLFICIVFSTIRFIFESFIYRMIVE